MPQVDTTFIEPLLVIGPFAVLAGALCAMAWAGLKFWWKGKL